MTKKQRIDQLEKDRFELRRDLAFVSQRVAKLERQVEELQARIAVLEAGGTISVYPAIGPIKYVYNEHWVADTAGVAPAQDVPRYHVPRTTSGE